MTKLEHIAKFLQSLKLLHKTGEADFTVTCSKCGSTNCQICVFPDIWEEIQGTDKQKDAVGVKCVDCGAAKIMEYELGSLYG